jgi:hypothetical protein
VAGSARNPLLAEAARPEATSREVPESRTPQQVLCIVYLASQSGVSSGDRA